MIVVEETDSIEQDISPRDEEEVNIQLPMLQAMHT